MTAADGMMLWTSDYLADTQHLTTFQHGAYLLILMAIWRNGGSLPADEERLARSARMTTGHWHRYGKPVLDLLQIEDGRITQKRLKQEFSKTICKIQKRSEAGRAGGLAKSLNDKQRALANATILPEQKATDAPETKTQTKNRKKDSRSVADATRPVDGPFEVFWAAYPKRKGPNPKKPARAKYHKLVRDGIAPEQIMVGVRRHADQMRETGKVGTEYVPRSDTWLNQWSPEDDAPSPAVIVAKSTKFFVQLGTPQWTAWDSHFRAINGVGAPQTDIRWPDQINSPLRRGYLFDTEFPPAAEPELPPLARAA